VWARAAVAALIGIFVFFAGPTFPYHAFEIPNPTKTSSPVKIVTLGAIFNVADAKPVDAALFARNEVILGHWESRLSRNGFGLAAYQGKRIDLDFKSDLSRAVVPRAGTGENGCSDFNDPRGRFPLIQDDKLSKIFGPGILTFKPWSEGQSGYSWSVRDKIFLPCYFFLSDGNISQSAGNPHLSASNFRIKNGDHVGSSEQTKLKNQNCYGDDAYQEREDQSEIIKEIVRRVGIGAGMIFGGMASAINSVRFRSRRRFRFWLCSSAAMSVGGWCFVLWSGLHPGIVWGWL